MRPIQWCRLESSAYVGRTSYLSDITEVIFLTLGEKQIADLNLLNTCKEKTSKSLHGFNLQKSNQDINIRMRNFIDENSLIGED